MFAEELPGSPCSPYYQPEDASFQTPGTRDICGRRTVAGTSCKRKIPCAMHGVDRPKATARWSVSEHLQFLTCLKVIGRGKWNTMASAIPSKTPSQIKSHAYSYFKRQRSSKKNSSLNDIHLTDFPPQEKKVRTAMSSTNRTLKEDTSKIEESAFMSHSLAASSSHEKLHSFQTFSNFCRYPDDSAGGPVGLKIKSEERPNEQPKTYHSDSSVSQYSQAHFYPTDPFAFPSASATYPSTEIEYAKRISVSDHHISCAPWVTKKDFVHIVREEKPSRSGYQNQNPDENEVLKMEAEATTISTDSGDSSDFSLESIYTSFSFPSFSRSSFSFTVPLSPTSEENQLKNLPEQNIPRLFIDDDVMSSWMEEIIQL